MANQSKFLPLGLEELVYLLGLGVGQTSRAGDGFLVTNNGSSLADDIGQVGLRWRKGESAFNKGDASRVVGWEGVVVTTLAKTFKGAAFRGQT